MRREVTFKEVRTITRNMSVLYVEDDEGIGMVYQEILNSLFMKVYWALNGEEGLSNYNDGEWDLVISDIQMPKMDGIAMTRQIKEINEEQPIIVTSAYNDSYYLLELINLGVQNFIAKPAQTQVFLRTLYTVCHMIEERKLARQYMDSLEKATIELELKNRQIERLLVEATMKEHTLDLALSKVQQTSVPFYHSKELQTFIDVLTREHYAEICGIEDEIYDFACYFNVVSLSEEDIFTLVNKFQKYGEILNSYGLFEKLGKEIIAFGATILSYKANLFVQKNTVSIYFESFAVTLKRWRKTLFLEGIHDPHFFDASLMSDMAMITQFLSGQVNPNELDFFHDTER